MTAVAHPINAKTLDLHVSPLGRVEGDLDVRVRIDDGVVTAAHTEAAMFRGFEIILKGKDPQAGLIVTPRICGICGGSHLYKSVYALDTAWKTEVPHNATLVRNIAQASETLLSIPRWFYALFAIDLTNKNYAKANGYDEAVRRFAPFVGTSYEPGVTVSAKPAEIYAIFGGQWPHSSFMIPGGVMCGPTLSDVTRSIAILDYWKDTWLEKVWLGGSVDRYLECKTWADLETWMHESQGHYNSDCGFFMRFAKEIGLDKFGGGYGNFLATGTYFNPELYDHPTIEGRNAALIERSGLYAKGQFYEFDQANVREDHTHSFYEGAASLHPFEGRTVPVDPELGRKQGKYTWAKAPRYEIPGVGSLPVEVGPLARQVMAGKPGAAGWQDGDGMFLDAINTVGPSIFVRVMSRMHEAAKYYKLVRKWLGDIKLQEKFYIKPAELTEGKGFGSTEAARGALSDWIVLKDGKIENYQVITPTAWNIGPRDSADVAGTMERAFVGTTIADTKDPVELGHVARSFDSCLVCTVHAYDGKTGKELTKFQIGGVC
ncbi:MAG: nickel-dependent hydrogenase large subunit [Anaerolineales bacterium]|nr:nickel-dependent hydrogenase large subunit [Anaerolineales bacterium]